MQPSLQHATLELTMTMKKKEADLGSLSLPLHQLRQRGGEHSNQVVTPIIIPVITCHLGTESTVRVHTCTTYMVIYNVRMYCISTATAPLRKYYIYYCTVVLNIIIGMGMALS